MLEALAAMATVTVAAVVAMTVAEMIVVKVTVVVEKKQAKAVPSLVL